MAVAGCNGYGIRGFSVTVPNNADWTNILSIIYSIFIFVIFGVWIVLSVVLHTVFLMAGTVFICILPTLNDGILKQIVRQSRPSGTCVTSYGMPSGHAITAIGFSTWLALELLFHRPFQPLWQRLVSIFIWWVILVPVPATRVNLRDHSELQVTVGSIVGISTAVSYFLILHLFCAKRFDCWIDAVEGFFERNLCEICIQNDYWTGPSLSCRQGDMQAWAQRKEQRRIRQLERDGVVGVLEVVAKDNRQNDDDNQVAEPVPAEQQTSLKLQDASAVTFDNDDQRHI